MKNTHLTHIEDLVFDEGLSGAKRAVALLKEFSTQPLSVKWDGAPALYAGIDPSDGVFFVAKKGIFNKTPKVYKTDSDIDADTTGELNNKLKQALKHLSGAGIEGVVQGDFLFSKEDVKTVDINGIPHVTFHPNTIVYAVPEDSEEGKAIKAADIGVVWHTRYRGSSFAEMSADFGEEISQSLIQNPAVFMMDAKTPSFALNSNTQRLIDNLDEYVGGVSDDLVLDAKFVSMVNMFVNQLVRLGRSFGNVSVWKEELAEFIRVRHFKEIASKKTEKGKETWRKALDTYVEMCYNLSETQVHLHMRLRHIKSAVLADAQEKSLFKTYLLMNNELVQTGHEGYVLGDKNAVKLVDREVFSKANFSEEVTKGW
jgi:hypothetical protein